VTPLFLSLAHVLRIHRSMIEQYGGEEGIRDAGLLQSAIAVPQASFGGEYLHADLFEMAAAYLYHIVQNHPFLDGNKRTGAAAAIVFLAMNDVLLRADEEGLIEITLRVASGNSGKSEVAAFLRTIGEA
jgi:death-on-curing protein